MEYKLTIFSKFYDSILTKINSRLIGYFVFWCITTTNNYTGLLYGSAIANCNPATRNGEEVLKVFISMSLPLVAFSATLGCLCKELVRKDVTIESRSRGQVYKAKSLYLKKRKMRIPCSMAQMIFWCGVAYLIDAKLRSLQKNVDISQQKKYSLLGYCYLGLECCITDAVHILIVQLMFTRYKTHRYLNALLPCLSRIISAYLKFKFIDATNIKQKIISNLLNYYIPAMVLCVVEFVNGGLYILFDKDSYIKCYLIPNIIDAATNDFKCNFVEKSSRFTSLVQRSNFFSNTLLDNGKYMLKITDDWCVKHDLEIYMNYMWIMRQLGVKRLLCTFDSRGNADVTIKYYDVHYDHIRYSNTKYDDCLANYYEKIEEYNSHYVKTRRQVPLLPAVEERREGQVGPLS